MRDKVVQKSSFEGEIVRYYNAFFLDEERLEREISHIQRLIEKYAVMEGFPAILDIGCGTGAHDVKLAQRGFKVKGIDISEDMVAFARNSTTNENVEFKCCNIQQSSFPKAYSVCISLSHVIGYQIENLEVEKMLSNIFESLQKGGIFIFNFYNIAGILENGLRAQKKEVIFERGRILRFSNAEMDLSQSVLNLAYNYFIEDGDKQFEIEINEKMRYFSKKEMSYYIEKAGFEVLKMYNYMGYNQGESWNCGVVCRKAGSQA
ncbi:MAG: class I SAM-dependent methyltransferase [Lachnospiraceae bacterium]|nr:class I SAM-dependent methyltransferase [Lachnospiraceae bacterium]